MCCTINLVLSVLPAARENADHFRGITSCNEEWRSILDNQCIRLDLNGKWEYTVIKFKITIKSSRYRRKGTAQVRKPKLCMIMLTEVLSMRGLGSDSKQSPVVAKISCKHISSHTDQLLILHWPHSTDCSQYGAGPDMQHQKWQRDAGEGLAWSGCYCTWPHTASKWLRDYIRKRGVYAAEGSEKAKSHLGQGVHDMFIMGLLTLEILFSFTI